MSNKSPIMTSLSNVKSNCISSTGLKGPISSLRIKMKREPKGDNPSR